MVPFFAAGDMLVIRCFLATCLVLSLVLGSSARAQDAAATPPADQIPADQMPAGQMPVGQVDDVTAEPSEREQKLATYLSGAKFVGQFTIDGKEGKGSKTKDPKTEEYTISRCEKLPAADMYRFTARIKYGDTDQEVPLDLKILWAGRTPVITLDNLWIPGMGTFSSRVLIHSDRYTGTWQHDAVGGHMFGKIVPKKPATE